MNCKKIKRQPFLYAMFYSLIGLMLISFMSSAYPSTTANATHYAKIPSNNTLSAAHIKNKTIIIINGQSTENYVLRSLQKQGFFLINLVTSPSNGNDKNTVKSALYSDTIEIKTNISETLESLKLLFHTKKYTLSDVFSAQQMDASLADKIRESFGKPFNGELFRNFNLDKINALNQLNKMLDVKVKTHLVAVEEFTKTISQQTLPCAVKVISGQHIISTYLVSQSSDIAPVLEKLKTHKGSDIKLWLQPYYKNVYRLQTTNFQHQTRVVSLWHEKTSLINDKIQEDVCTLVHPNELEIMSKNDLALLAKKLSDSLHLSHGMGEFVLAFHKNKIVVIDYNLALPHHNHIEVMEKVIGYSPVSRYLMHAGLGTETPSTEKEFKNIVVLNLLLKNKNDLLKLSILPTFYRYYPHQNNKEEFPLPGELYLVHVNKNLIMASCAGIQNKEKLLSHSLYASHSASHIVNFYRDAAMNKKADYTLNKEIKSPSSEAEEALKKLSHESKHIPKFVKPLDNKAGIQDIMRYYIDIYDLYILHGKAPGTSVIAMNTGNPAFLPFPPIVNALRKSLQENLSSYARYSMQVPETDFVNKLTRYCQEERILTPQQTLQPNNVVMGHGSTNVYYLALKSIIKNKGDIVLITRPTYGLFIDPVYTAGGEIGFIDITESEGWKVQPEKLHETIHFYNQKAFNNYILTTFLKEYDKFIQALTLFNLDQELVPSMPTLEGITNLKVFDTYIEKLNAYIERITDPVVNKEELKFSLPPRVKAFYHMNPHNPTGAVYTKKELEEIAKIIKEHPGIYVIDDLAHWGVLYEESEPATFASLDNMFDKTLTLISLSKSYCVPGLRTGVAIGNREIISEMQYRLLNSSSSATLPAMIALDTVFSTPQEERNSYLKSNSQEYLFRRNLMGVLVNGIQQTKLTSEQKMRIYKLIIENEYKEGKPFDKKFLNLILSGMPLVRTLTEPKGCFFHLLDISKLIGEAIGNNSPLQTSTDVRNAIYSICNVDTVPGEMSGNFFNYSLRMSFSLPPHQIYNACKNIHLFISNYIIKYNPSILEKRHSSNDLSVKLNGVDVFDDVNFNKALIRFYLNQGIQSLTPGHNTTNKKKLHDTEQKITELNSLMQKLLDQSFDQTIHNEIDDFIKKNEVWLKDHLHDLEQLKAINQTAFKK